MKELIVTIWFYLSLRLAVLMAIGIMVVLIIYKKELSKERYEKTLSSEDVAKSIWWGIVLIILFVIFAFYCRDQYYRERNAILLINEQYNADFTLDDWHYNKKIVEEIIGKKYAGSKEEVDCLEK